MKLKIGTVALAPALVAVGVQADSFGSGQMPTHSMPVVI